MPSQLAALSRRPAPSRNPVPPRNPKPKLDQKILFQRFFKSVGPRTYAAQVKEASNGNQFIVLTEGKRDKKTGEVRKTSVYVFSEDFEAFIGLLRDTFGFVKSHPVSLEVQKKQEAYWAKHGREGAPEKASAAR